MPFPYYRRLTRRQQAIYRKSDAIGAIPISDCSALLHRVERVRLALQSGERIATQRATSALLLALCEALGAPPVVSRVLARRPSNSEAELHGLYEREEGKRAIIRVWMRTAAHERTVAFRTFMRTVLHELCHHLDYELFELEDSFHTEGFFRRESSLARQLLPAPTRRKKKPEPPPNEPPEPRRRRPTREKTTAPKPAAQSQLELF